MFSFNLAINVHCKCVKVSQLTQLTREGIESNPGPRNYAIKKALLASHHQGHSRYRDSAGMQFTSIAYFSIICSAVKGRLNRLIWILYLHREMNYLNLLRSINHLLWMNLLRVMIFPAKDFPMKVI